MCEVYVIVSYTVSSVNIMLLFFIGLSGRAAPKPVEKPQRAPGSNSGPSVLCRFLVGFIMLLSLLVHHFNCDSYCYQKIYFCVRVRVMRFLLIV